MSEVLKWLEEESDRLTEESLSSADPHKTVNNSFLEGFNYALANVQGLDQPQLNENQQIVLEWLKNIYNSPIIINPIAVVFSLHYELVKDSEIDAVEAYEELGFDEEIQVLQVFSQWAQEQEEE